MDIEQLAELGRDTVGNTKHGDLVAASLTRRRSVNGQSSLFERVHAILTKRDTKFIRARDFLEATKRTRLC